MSASIELQSLGTQLAAVRAGTLKMSAFSDAARTHTELLRALPPRYGEVLLGLLDRLESSALFSEESCSFSQSGLFENLDVWIAKAGAQLAASKAPSAA